MSEKPYDGGCLCGAVRYRATEAPIGVALCHCSMCRRASGAPAVAWATFRPAAFAFTQGTPVGYASSPLAGRTFCGRCGSPLTFQFNNRTGPDGEIDVTVGTLDAPERLAPTRHVFVADQLAWLRLDDDLPRHAGFTPR